MARVPPRRNAITPSLNGSAARSPQTEWFPTFVAFQVGAKETELLAEKLASEVTIPTLQSFSKMRETPARPEPTATGASWWRPMAFTDEQAARALVQILAASSWEAVAVAHGYLAILNGKTDEEAARLIYDHKQITLKKCREIVGQLKARGFLACLRTREKLGSAENPVTKLFPAAITERRFIELIDTLHDARSGVSWNDDRQEGHTLTDFTLNEEKDSLPINIKNAGTKFPQAKSLVGLEPEDCIPIPAYKAYAAVEKLPSLLYIISVDYDLAGKLTGLPTLLEPAEAITWELLNKYAGSYLRRAEDLFVSHVTQKYWSDLAKLAAQNPFHVISARRAIRILQDKPERTPGIGLRAWGTGASAEVNVHISIKAETTPWTDVADRITRNGLVDIIKAVNRKRKQWVYDPEI